MNVVSISQGGIKRLQNKRRTAFTSPIPGRPIVPSKAFAIGTQNTGLQSINAMSSHEAEDDTYPIDDKATNISGDRRLIAAPTIDMSDSPD
jgi:hypothetical protein